MKTEVRGTGNQRYRVYADGCFAAGYTTGRFRPYVYPLCTPTGVPVTEESPADHPHHQSLWLGQDEVNGVNFWVNEPGCGRVTGPDPAWTVEPAPDGDAAVFRHDLVWATPAGEPLLAERRVTAITPTPGAVLVDISSRRRPAGGPVAFGATKEAGLGLRVLDPLDESDGGVLSNSNGAEGEHATMDSDADWVDYSGVVGGRAAGVAMFPHPENPRHPWFTRGYGLVVLNHHRFQPQLLQPGECLLLRWRIAVHDGSADEAGVAELYRRYRSRIEHIDELMADRT